MLGFFMLVTILGGVIAQGFISQRLIVFSDGAATANNILSASYLKLMPNLPLKLRGRPTVVPEKTLSKVIR